MLLCPDDNIVPDDSRGCGIQDRWTNHSGIATRSHCAKSRKEQNSVVSRIGHVEPLRCRERQPTRHLLVFSTELIALNPTHTQSLLTQSLTLTHSHSLTHSLIHSLTHSLTHSLPLTHSHSLTHSLMHSHSLTYSLTH